MPIIPEYRLEYFDKTALQKFGDIIEASEVFVSELNHMEQEPPPALVFYGLDDEAQHIISGEQQSLLQSLSQKTINIVLELRTQTCWDSGQEMLRLHEALCQYDDFTFPAFDIAYGIYWIKSNPGLLLNSENLAFYNIGCSFLSRLAVGLDKENSINWGRIISQTLAELPEGRDKQPIKSLYGLTGMTATQVLKWLPAFLADDIKAYLNSKKMYCLSITIKGYEKLFTENVHMTCLLEKDYWLRELIAHLPEIMWIILSSIRVPWDEYYPQWKSRLKQYLAGSLNEYDILRHLISQGITENKDQEGILHFSQGIPFCLDLATKNYRL